MDVEIGNQKDSWNIQDPLMFIIFLLCQFYTSIYVMDWVFVPPPTLQIPMLNP